jgi:solute carrier family 10 (sodium/bile acid cotransporter), member 7
MIGFARKYWFLLGLAAVAVLAIADSSALTVTPGIWLGAHKGADVTIVLIFFLSGIALDGGQIRQGLTDYAGTILALILIFAIAPALAMVFALLPLATGIVIGLYLVAVMPSTLSSGVVMTGSAGGNMAHALLITIIANSLAVVTIPVSLDFLASTRGDIKVVAFDQLSIMIKIAGFVLLPLLGGIVLRHSTRLCRFLLPYTGTVNQIAILFVVWMAMCSGRAAIIAELDTLGTVIVTVFFFHLVLVGAALLTTRMAGINTGRRESVIFMGGQKTLALSVVLQLSLFPEYAIALVVCVIHHIVHLIMDAFLVGWLREKKE